METVQKRQARPLISRHGGTHMVDLAVGAEQATRGMQRDYSFQDSHGDTVSSYRQPAGQNVSPLSSYAYGAGEVVVTESAEVDDEAYLNDDIQSEPSEADGEGQNMGGGQEELPRRTR